MKTIANNYEVSARSFYYLLDWNDRDNWVTIYEKFGTQKLSELTIDEYRELWLHATTTEYNNL